MIDNNDELFPIDKSSIEAEREELIFKLQYSATTPRQRGIILDRLSEIKLLLNTF